MRTEWNGSKDPPSSVSPLFPRVVVIFALVSALPRVVVSASTAAIPTVAVTSVPAVVVIAALPTAAAVSRIPWSYRLGVAAAHTAVAVVVGSSAIASTAAV